MDGYVLCYGCLKDVFCTLLRRVHWVKQYEFIPRRPSISEIISRKRNVLYRRSQSKINVVKATYLKTLNKITFGINVLTTKQQMTRIVNPSATNSKTNQLSSNTDFDFSLSSFFCLTMNSDSMVHAG